jgi:hypothetical protein
MEWTLTLRVFTPLVMAGAEQQGLAEWRAASVKGVVRWWFRIAGGSRSDEERLFGAVGQGGARASLLTVETPPVSGSPTLNRLPAPYFGFSIRMNRRGVIPAGEALSVTFRVSPWADEADVDRIRAAVWLAFYLGNFGTRSRKGYGSLVVTESTDPFFEALPPSAEQMATVYRQKIKSAISTISPSSCRMKGVWLVRRSWGDMEVQYKAMRRAMGVPDKAYLGYPFHKCRSCSEPSDPEWSADRFASPLIIKPLADDIAVLTYIGIPDAVQNAFQGRRLSPQFDNFEKKFEAFKERLSPQQLWP